MPGLCDAASATVSYGHRLALLLPLDVDMLKLLGSIAIARLLGFGIVGFIVIYLLLTLLS